MRDDLVDRVKNSVDIVDVVSNYITLDSRGKNYFGLCPFHNDKNPSLSVSREKQIYKCFSCGESGNVYNFVMNYENISFRDALKKLAKYAGIEDASLVDRDISRNKKDKKLYDAYDLASKYYQNNLSSKRGKSARGYLETRKIGEKEIEKFSIGLSLNGNNLKSYLEDIGYEDTLLESLGLIKNNHDMFQNRIMFPLADLEGNVVGFSARVFDNKTDEAKYINTTETKIFKKGELLYNYHQVKRSVREKNYLIITEGFMDVIRLYTVGIENVVAVMGTALTDKQINEIRKLSKNVYLCFDEDRAGIDANLRNGEALNKKGFNVKVIKLEKDLDPDTFIIEYGKDEFLKRIEDAVSYSEYFMTINKEKIKNKDIDDLSKFISEVLEKLKFENDEIKRELILKKLAKDYDLSYNTLEKRLEKLRSGIRSQDKRGNLYKPKKKEKLKIKRDKYFKASASLILGMLKDSNVIKLYEKDPVKMISDSFDELSNLILNRYAETGSVSGSDIYTDLIDNEELLEFYKIIEEEDAPDNLKYYEDCLKSLKTYYKDLRIKELEKEIAMETDSKRQAELTNEILKIRNENNLQ